MWTLRALTTGCHLCLHGGTYLALLLSCFALGSRHLQSSGWHMVSYIATEWLHWSGVTRLHQELLPPAGQGPVVAGGGAAVGGVAGVGGGGVAGVGVVGLQHAGVVDGVPGPGLEAAPPRVQDGRVTLLLRRGAGGRGAEGEVGVIIVLVSIRHPAQLVLLLGPEPELDLQREAGELQPHPEICLALL